MASHQHRPDALAALRFIGEDWAVRGVNVTCMCELWEERSKTQGDDKNEPLSQNDEVNMLWSQDGVDDVTQLQDGEESVLLSQDGEDNELQLQHVQDIVLPSQDCEHNVLLSWDEEDNVHLSKDEEDTVSLPRDKGHNVFLPRDDGDNMLLSGDGEDNVLQSQDDEDNVLQSQDDEKNVPLSQDDEDNVLQSQDDEKNVPPSQGGEDNVLQSQDDGKNVPLSQDGEDNVLQSQDGEKNVPLSQDGEDNVLQSQDDEKNVPPSQDGEDNVLQSQDDEKNVPLSQDGEDNVLQSQDGEKNVPLSQDGEDNVLQSQDDEKNVPPSQDGEDKELLSRDSEDNVPFSQGDEDDAVLSQDGGGNAPLSQHSEDNMLLSQPTGISVEFLQMALDEEHREQERQLREQSVAPSLLELEDIEEQRMIEQLLLMAPTVNTALEEQPEEPSWMSGLLQSENWFEEQRMIAQSLGMQLADNYEGDEENVPLSQNHEDDMLFSRGGVDDVPQLQDGEDNVHLSKDEEDTVSLPRDKGDNVFLPRDDGDNMLLSGDGEDNVLQPQDDEDNVLQSQDDEKNVPLSQDDEDNVLQSQDDGNNVPLSQDGEDNVLQSQDGEKNVPLSQDGEDNVLQSQDGEKNVPLSQDGEDNVLQSQDDEKNVPLSQDGEDNVLQSQDGGNNVPPSQGGEDDALLSQDGEENALLSQHGMEYVLLLEPIGEQEWQLGEQLVLLESEDIGEQQERMIEQLLMMGPAVNTTLEEQLEDPPRMSGQLQSENRIETQHTISQILGLKFTDSYKFREAVFSIAVEAVVPQCAIIRLPDSDVERNRAAFSRVQDGTVFAERERHRVLFGGVIAGSQAEGLAQEEGWGHPQADIDHMQLLAGPLGVHVSQGHHPLEHVFRYRPEGCPPAYCKIEVTGVQGDMQVDKEIIHRSEEVAWLITHNLLRRIKGDNVIGPAGQYDDGSEYIPTLVGREPYPDMDRNYLHRPRRGWPSPQQLEVIKHCLMLLVLTGHKLSDPDQIPLQARHSWSHCELELITTLPLYIKQAYIAIKYVFKCLMKTFRGTDTAVDGRSTVSSYYLKTVFLRLLEKTPPIMIGSQFGFMYCFLSDLDDYLKAGNLPHYFLPECNLLVTVGPEERRLARYVIRHILSDPLHAILTCPTHPNDIYGKVPPDTLVAAFHQLSSDLTSVSSREHLLSLLRHLDETRRERYWRQREEDERRMVSGRPEVRGLVEMLWKRIQVD